MRPSQLVLRRTRHPARPNALQRRSRARSGLQPPGRRNRYARPSLAANDSRQPTLSLPAQRRLAFRPAARRPPASARQSPRHRRWRPKPSRRPRLSIWSAPRRAERRPMLLPPQTRRRPRLRPSSFKSRGGLLSWSARRSRPSSPWSPPASRLLAGVSSADCSSSGPLMTVGRGFASSRVCRARSSRARRLRRTCAGSRAGVVSCSGPKTAPVSRSSPHQPTRTSPSFARPTR